MAGSSDDDDDAPSPTANDFTSLFEFLPIGAYRTSPEGAQLRANPALVRMNGYDDEAQMLASVHDIAGEWYVDPTRRDQFRALLQRDGHVTHFASEVYRHRTRERIWVVEHAHMVRDADGRPLYYEGTVEEVTEQRKSEAQLRQIAQQFPGMVFRVLRRPDGQRDYSYVSDGVQALFGLTPAELLADGARLAALVPHDDLVRMEAETRAAADRDVPLTAEFRVVLPDGQRKWIQMHSGPLSHGAEGTLRSGLMIDITGHKEAAAALRESEDRWRLALESTGDGMWDWNVEHGLEFVSPRLRQMYGWGDELEANPSSIDALTHPDDVPQMLHDREEHFAGRTPAYVNEHRMRCRDGSWKWILTRGMVIKRDGAGRPLRMIGTHTDITERKRADALRLERDRAELAHRTMSEMLSRISHELRTPLNAVLGLAQLLALDGTLSSQHQRWVQQIHASGLHLLGLVDDVLDLSSAQSGEMRLTPAPLDLAALIEETWAMAESAARAEGQRSVQWLPHFAAPLTIQADRKRLTQVLVNLLSNAIKYNREGGAVEVGARIDGPVVELSVHDDGPGMSDEQLARLFQPFDRLGAEHGRVDGRGLGLALTRQLVEAMGGAIGVSSTLGAGSTFTLHLPVETRA